MTDRILVRGILVATSPIAVGSGDREGDSDSPVIRDFFGDPFIPGSSLAGVLRSLLTETTGDELFGSLESGGTASRLLVSSAWLIGEDGRPCWQNHLSKGGDKTAALFSPRVLRDHVRIGQTGSAEQAGKYDEELVPRGARFGFEFEFLPLAGDKADLIQRMHSALASLLAALKAGEVRVGGGTTSGFGRIQAESLDARVLPSRVDSKAEFEQLAALGLDHRFEGASKLPKWELPAAGSAAKPAWRIEGKLQCDGSLLIGGGLAEDEADITCYREPVFESNKIENRFVIPGSSLKGVLRHRATEIATAVFPDSATRIVADLFGPSADSGKDLRRGAISVDDVLFERDPQTMIVPHVAIDRFTQGALDGALFQEKPLWGNQPLTFDARLEVRPLPDHSLADTHLFVLAQTLLDLAQGLIRVGHGTRRGNGILRLAGPLTKEGTAKHVKVWANGEPQDFGKLEALAKRLDQSVAEAVK